jgi:hypothetical protein
LCRAPSRRLAEAALVNSEVIVERINLTMADLVTIASFREPQEAHMLAARLRSEGLFASVAHQFHVGNNWWYSTALWGVKVQVASENTDAARTIERACRSGEYNRHLAAELGDLDEVRCPHCGANDYRKRRPIYQCALAGVTILFTSFPLPPWTWILICKNCGTEFSQRYGLIGKASEFELPITFAEAKDSDVEDMRILAELTGKDGHVETEAAQYEHFLADGGVAGPAECKVSSVDSCWLTHQPANSQRSSYILISSTTQLGGASIAQRSTGFFGSTKRRSR